MQLYVHRAGQQYGPYSVEEVQNYLASGNLAADDMAWHEGATDWAPLAQVIGAVSLPAAAPTQPNWVPTRRDDSPAPTSVKTFATNGTAPHAAAPGFATNPAPQVSSAPSPSPQSAAAVATQRQRSSSSRYINPQMRAIGARNMLIGGLWCGGGTAVTVFSYEAAATSPGGGTYFMAWGAILFGGIQFVRGAVQFFKA